MKKVCEIIEYQVYKNAGCPEVFNWHMVDSRKLTEIAKIANV